VAKFRAARRMWAHLTRSLGATDERAQMLRFHTQTGGSTLTAQQPMNNIVRVAIQALSAVLGGTQSLHTNGYDEALSLPTESAAGLALRTQQIIAHESGVTQTVDPLGGSFFVEALTNEMEQKALLYLEQIEGMGGSVAAIEQGFMQEEIARSAYRYQQEIERGEKVIVGVNRFAGGQEEPIPVFRVDDSIRGIQTARLRELKSRRNESKVAEILQQLEADARQEVNLMPTVIEAAEHLVTLGEIADTLRKIFGEYK